MELLSELLFSAGVSVDGFTIGCSYGIRNLRSRLFTNIISALICAGASALAIFFGTLILKFIPVEFSSYLGIMLLIVLGLYTIIKGLLVKNSSSPPDFDRQISIKESLVLSLTVSIDAFSAGLGYAMMGHTSFIIPIAVGIFHSVFISLGIGFSRRVANHFNLSKKLLTIISGLIIISVAVSRIFF